MDVKTLTVVKSLGCSSSPNSMRRISQEKHGRSHSARVQGPFYRLEHSRNADLSSVGFGMSIAQTVAHAQGGQLLLRNVPEGGFEVTLKLPQR